jgi:F-type H+-transporting ATPase subunit epsilon
MAEKLHFSLVSPEREVFSGEVDQVVAPGVEGDFGVLAGHTPFMTVLKLGEVVVLNGTERRVFEIQGGFADVTPAGLTILAEHAIEYGPGVHDDGHTRRPEGVGPKH